MQDVTILTWEHKLAQTSCYSISPTKMRCIYMLYQCESVTHSFTSSPPPSVWGEKLPFNTVCGEYSSPTGGWVHSVGFSPSGDVLAFARSEGVQTIRGLLKLCLLPTGDDHSGTILYECLSAHLAQASGAARDEDDMVFVAEEVGDAQVGCC